MSDKRDPMHDPKAGDVITKNTGKRVLTRTVLPSPKDNYVYYRNEREHLRRCWITSWWEWCRGAEVCKKA